jgi:hypothetical protein
MPGFGSIRVAKGVRISASSRGLRTHVGPRGARLHLGGGCTGVSTGAGPFTYYTSGSDRRSSRGSGPNKAGLARSEKLVEGARLQAEILSIIEIHRVTFQPIDKPVVERPIAPRIDSFVKRRENEQLQGISLFKRAERKQAKTRAKQLAVADLKQEQERLDAEHRSILERIDRDWERLVGNDPDTVISTVETAFEDNQAPAAPVNVEGTTLSLAVLVPDIEDVPERKPSVTPSGNPTVKKMTKKERADLYLTLVCGHLLATIKEGLAVAPSIFDVKAVVVRRATDDVFGKRRMEVLLAGRYERSDLERVRWDEALPSDVVQEAAVELSWNFKGRPPQLQPLNLEDEPGLREFVAALNDGPLT